MTDANALVQSGLQHHLANRADQAESLYRQALTAHPKHADALHLLGVLLAQRGQHADALPLIERAIEQMPHIAEFHRHLADVLGLLNRPDEAINSYFAALRIDGNDVLSAYNAARYCAQLGRTNDALNLLQHTVQLQPNNAHAWCDFGTLLIRIHQHPQALEALQRALALMPDLAPALTSISDALRHLNRIDEAAEPARRGVELQPNEPWAHVAYGNVLQMLARFDESADEYRKALALDPDNFDATNNLGLVLLKNAKPRESLGVFEQAVKRWPDAYDLRANYSLALLTLGDLDRGFDEYESRFKSQAFRDANFPSIPRWDGSDIAGKTILLNAEQGLGDTIQFARYIPLIAARRARDRLLPAGDPRPHRHRRGRRGSLPDQHRRPALRHLGPHGQPAPHLPHHAGHDPQQSSVPARDPARVAHWRNRLTQHSGLSTQHLRIGIAWSGSPLHQNDRSRSTRLEHFLPLAQVENIQLFSLQKGPSAAALPRDSRIIPLGDELTNFTETAALVEALDLVISVDTSVVHVAGALARPVWTLLPAGPDWRWMLDRSDSPWYPTMILFRQPTPGDWPAVFQQVNIELQSLQSSMTH